MVYRGSVLGLTGGGCTGVVSENTGEDRGFIRKGDFRASSDEILIGYIGERRFEPREQQGIGNAWLYRITVY